MAAQLGASLHPLTAAAVAELLRPTNSYYSNLIEGHDTHPLDIDRALHADFASELWWRSLQLEARAHIALHRRMGEQLRGPDQPVNLYDAIFWREIHRAFYEELTGQGVLLILRCLAGIPKARNAAESPQKHHSGPYRPILPGLKGQSQAED